MVSDECHSGYFLSYINVKSLCSTPKTKYCMSTMIETVKKYVFKLRERERENCPGRQVKKI